MVLIGNLSKLYLYINAFNTWKYSQFFMVVPSQYMHNASRVVSAIIIDNSWLSSLVKYLHTYCNFPFPKKYVCLISHFVPILSKIISPPLGLSYPFVIHGRFFLKTWPRVFPVQQPHSES